MTASGGWTYRDASAAAAWTQRLAWASAAVAAGTMAFAVSRGFSPAEVGAAEAGLLIVQFLLYIVTAAVTLRWIYLAHVNARALGASDMMVSPGWAVGWFFIPLMNLFMPFVAMRELWKASARPRDWQLEPVPAALVMWWILWVGAGIAGVISFSLALGKDTMASADIFTFLSDLLFIGAAFLLAWIVGRIQAMQAQTGPTAVFA